MWYLSILLVPDILTFILDTYSNFFFLPKHVSLHFDTFLPSFLNLWYQVDHILPCIVCSYFVFECLLPFRCTENSGKIDLSRGGKTIPNVEGEDETKIGWDSVAFDFRYDHPFPVTQSHGSRARWGHVCKCRCLQGVKITEPIRIENFGSF